MARKTSLRLLGERRVELTPDEPDDRSVVAAFPRREEPVEDNDTSVLEILRRSHERSIGEIAQATATAGAATDRAAESVDRVGEIGRAAISVIDENTKALRGVVRERLTDSTVGVLNRLSSFAIDRLPALFSIGSAFWLWRGVLADPQPIQLAALGLYGACVIGPAIWLSARSR